MYGAIIGDVVGLWSTRIPYKRSTTIHKRVYEGSNR